MGAASGGDGTRASAWQALYRSASDVLDGGRALPDVRMRPRASAAVPSAASVEGIFGIPPSPFALMGRNDAADLEKIETVEIDLSHYYPQDVEIVASRGNAIEAPSHHYSATDSVVDDARAWLDSVCPSALTRIDGASLAFDAHGPDYEAQVSVSIRRALQSLADALCSPSAPKSDRDGKLRKLGPDNYVNRILRYLDVTGVGGGHYAIAKRDMEYLASVLDDVIDRCQKGVHHQATAHETRRVIFLTWNLLGELAYACR